MSTSPFGSHELTLSTDRLRITQTRHEPALRTPAHDHDKICLHYVLAGLYEESTRRGRHLLTPGWLLFKPAGEVHWNTFSGEGSTTLRLELVPDASPRLVERLPSWSTVTRSPHLAALASRAHHELTTHDDLSAMTAEAISFELLVALARMQRPPAGSDRSLAERCARFLDERFTTSVGLGEASRHLGVDRTQLAQIFRHELGCTIGEYIRVKRLELVAAALRAPSPPSLAELALEAGFSDQSHLTRSFKKAFGQPPGRWRRTLGITSR